MNEPKSKAEFSRERVLDAAARVFRERGYEGATMREIARQAGVEAGSIYYHYRSKEELISAVLSVDIASFLKNVSDALAALPANAGARKRIETAISAHLATIMHFGDQSLSVRRLLHQVPANVRSKHTQLSDQYRLMWQQILDDAAAAGIVRTGVNLNIARLFLLGALTWTAEWFDPKRKSPESLSAEFSKLFLNGLLAEKFEDEKLPGLKASSIA